MKDPWTITEHIKPNNLEFNFLSFREIAENLRVALTKGYLKRNKRYKMTIQEV